MLGLHFQCDRFDHSIVAVGRPTPDTTARPFITPAQSTRNCYFRRGQRRYSQFKGSQLITQTRFLAKMPVYLDANKTHKIIYMNHDTCQQTKQNIGAVRSADNRSDVGSYDSVSPQNCKYGFSVTRDALSRRPRFYRRRRT
jgi:hypothetical protein